MKQVTRPAPAAVLAGGAVNTHAYEAGDWIVRLGATTVAPDEDSDSVVLPTAPATVLPGVSIDNDTQLGIIPVYMLTDNWGWNYWLQPRLSTMSKSTPWVLTLALLPTCRRP